MADNQPQGKNGSVFISYSRKDKEFVRKLYDGLVANDVKAWVDWEGIPLSADWMAEITHAVNGADAFLVVLSPDWLTSEVCTKELNLGLNSNKKLIPILYREAEKGTAMHEKLAATNWVYMRAQDDFDDTLPKLIGAINTDLDWVRQHTRLLGRAIEWDKKNRDSSFLLQGADLEDGEKWMSEAAQHASREVLSIQAEYIAASRKDAVRRQRVLLVGVSLALAVSVVLAILAIFQWNAATLSEAKAVDKEHARATQQVKAEENEKLAKEQEELAKKNEALAKDNEALAKKNEIIALAQRNAAEAQLRQDKAGELASSTLLAIDSWNHAPSSQAEEILRHNITLLPTPIIQMSQGGQINNILFTTDGQRFVTSSQDGTACVWNLVDGKQQYCVKHDKSVNSAVFSTDGKWLATGSEDGTAALWNAVDGSLYKTFNLGSTVWDIKFSPNSEWLVIAHDKGMKAYNIINHLQKDRDVVLPSAAHVLAYSPDGKWVGIGTAAGDVFIWFTGSLYTSHGPTHVGDVLDISISSDSKYIFSGGEDNTVRMAKLESGREIRFFRTGDWVEDIELAPDGTWIAAASDDNRIWVWNIKTGENITRLNHDNYVMKVKSSPNGLWLASTGFDQTIRVWNSRNNGRIIQADINNIGSALAFSPDGKRIIVGDRAGNITMWDVSSLAAKVGSIEFTEYVHTVRISPDGKSLLVNSDDQRVWSFDLSNIQSSHSTASAKMLFAAKGLTYNMEISPDSKWVVAAESQNYRAVLYSAVDNKTTILDHGRYVNGVAFTPDSSQVATAGDDNKVDLWDVSTGQKLTEFVNDSPALGVAISQDGKLLAVGQEGLHPTTVWNLTTGSIAGRLEQSGSVYTVTFSKDGNLLATGDNLGIIHLWNTHDLLAKPVQIIQSSANVMDLLFSPDSRWLLVGSADNDALIFDVATGDEISRIPHNGEVISLAFSNDGKLLFTVAEKNIQIWDIAKLILIRKDKLIDTACSRLVANFNLAQWQSLFPAEPYRPICPNLPQGKD